jgi:hypothetical protein
MGGAFIAVADLFRVGAVIPSMYQVPVTRGVRFYRVIVAYFFSLICGTLSVAVFFSPTTGRQWGVAVIAAVTIAGEKGWTRSGNSTVRARKKSRSRAVTENTATDGSNANIG